MLPSKNSAVLFAGLLALSVGGCTYSGGDIGNPVTRKTEWFSFINGDDMRQTCHSGSPDRYRLVYNARYDQQIRIYELDSLQKTLSVKVVDQNRLKAFDAHDLTAPWQADHAKRPLTDQDYTALTTALAADGVGDKIAVGLNLPSQSYYWTATTCRAGSVQVTGWLYPSASYAALTFPAALMAVDPSPVPPLAAKVHPYDPITEARLKAGESTSFNLKIGTQGLVR